MSTSNEENINALRSIGRWLCAHWKQILGVTFKLALIAIGGLAAFVLSVIGHEEWEDRYGSTGGRMISEKNQIFVVYFADHTARVKNLKTGKWTSSKQRWFADEPLQDSISVFCDREGKRGFYNTHTGRITIPGTYRHAWYFSNGVAAVVAEDDRIRFIDHEGNQAVPGSYHYTPGLDYVFKDGYCEFYNDSTGAYGILRKDGTWALKQEYRLIIRHKTAGVWLTCKEDQWQLLNDDFTPAIEGTFDNLKLAEEKEAVYATRNHIKQKLTLDGRVLEPFVIDDSHELHYTVKYTEDGANEYAISPDVIVYSVDGYEGLMDKNTGKILTPALYQDFEMISSSLIKATFAHCLPEGIVMDLKGRKVKHDQI